MSEKNPKKKGKGSEKKGKGSRGTGFSQTELDSLLDVVKDLLPLSNPEWMSVARCHSERWPDKERSEVSLRRKFDSVANSKMPTGNPHCPPHIHLAKSIRRSIIQSWTHLVLDLEEIVYLV